MKNKQQQFSVIKWVAILLWIFSIVIFGIGQYLAPPNYNIIPGNPWGTVFVLTVIFGFIFFIVSFGFTFREVIRGKFLGIILLFLFAGLSLFVISFLDNSKTVNKQKTYLQEAKDILSSHSSYKCPDVKIISSWLLKYQEENNIKISSLSADLIELKDQNMLFWACYVDRIDEYIAEYEESLLQSNNEDSQIQSNKDDFIFNKNNFNTPINNKIDCTGPDGKHFIATEKECNDFNNAWINPQEKIVNCSTNEMCGGKVLRITQKECDTMKCCNVNGSWSIFPNEDSCKNAQKGSTSVQNTNTSVKSYARINCETDAYTAYWQKKMNCGKTISSLNEPVAFQLCEGSAQSSYDTALLICSSK